MTGPRVLQVINEMGAGGAERVAAELARGPWTSCVVSSGGVRADELAADGVDVRPMRMARRSPLAMVRSVRDLRRAVRGFDPDVVLAHNVLVGIVAWLALHLMRRRPPLVTVFHGVAADDYASAARILSRTSDVVVAVSEAIARRLTAAGLRGPRLTVIRNAVPAPEHRERDAARRALDLPVGTDVVLCAARMVEQKRHDVLLRAWDQMPADAVLLLAGDGPLRAGLEESADHLGDRVRFLGTRDDVPELLSAADACVLTSDWEGLPMVVLESMAAGRPMVATDVDGVREALGDGAGVLVPAGDPGAVARGLRDVLDDAGKRDRVVRAAHDRIAADHDPAVVLDRYDAVLRDARLAPARPGRLWVGLRAASAGVLVFAAVLAGVLAAPAGYQGTVGMIARPDAGGSSVASGEAPSTGYGEVVALALPALPELATSPSILDGVSSDVPGAPSGTAIRPDVSVELLPGSGVARVSVRNDDPDTAAALAQALAARIEASRPLAPAGTLSPVDARAVVTEVSPGTTIGAALALLAGLVAAAVVAALLLPRRRSVPHAALLRAVTATGRAPVAVLDVADPVLRERLRLLAGDTVPRVVAAGPGLEDPVRALAADLEASRPEPGGRRPVVAVADRRRTGTGDLTGTVAALPADADLLAVVLV
ncbi:glycosyltransferase [Pseudonocardia endophytica]|uniref:Glycosyltransferase involved in cell wall biosynthesis n=1 Tax=Pseudonocardia endophytica TaxID=401976 RepID=A0A4R1HJ20_PSEEN|nr:glycosyltransferase [Pseudonocardia endophytica]TCK20883.1 glycosyltransferase involved in cell wall biosynthesis [Pseudonocardia endophytica]